MRSELKVSSRPSEDDVTKGKDFIMKFFFKAKIIFRCMLCRFRGLINAFVFACQTAYTFDKRKLSTNKQQTGFCLYVNSNHIPFVNEKIKVYL